MLVFTYLLDEEPFLWRPVISRLPLSNSCARRIHVPGIRIWWPSLETGISSLPWIGQIWVKSGNFYLPHKTLPTNSTSVSKCRLTDNWVIVGPLDYSLSVASSRWGLYNCRRPNCKFHQRKISICCETFDQRLTFYFRAIWTVWML